MTYRETMEYIEEMSVLGSVPGLDSIRELCRRLGNPQEELSFVHIAGTNGKGSVLAYLSAVLKTAGYRTGSYSSPGVLSYRERISINGQPILAREFAEIMTRIRNISDAMAGEGLAHPTVFEMETAAAFLYFQERACDLVILECGMGGRLDATNIVDNTLVCVFSSISMDHMAYLGKTLTEITEQKAGIIKYGTEVVSAPAEQEVLEVIEKELCKITGNDRKEKRNIINIAGRNRLSHIKYGLEKQRFDYISCSGTCYKQLIISMAGVVQPENAALAIEVIEALGRKGYPVSEKQLRQGFLKAVWPCRFQIISKRPLFIMDGAHNEDGARRLAESIRLYFTNRKIVYIIGILKDKEYEKILAETYAYAEEIITVTPPDTERALPAHELAKAACLYHPHVTEAASLEEAVEMAYLFVDREWVIIAFGSLSYMGKLSKILKDRNKKHDKSGKNKRGS